MCDSEEGDKTAMTDGHAKPTDTQNRRVNISVRVFFYASSRGGVGGRERGAGHIMFAEKYRHLKKHTMFTATTRGV